jgi:hypothetical protein
MIVLTRLYLFVLSFAVFGWACAEGANDDVTVVSSSPTPAPSSKKATDSDGTPVVHKSSHKKKSSTTETAATTHAPAASTSPAPVASTEVTPRKSAATASTVSHQPPSVSAPPTHVQPPAAPSVVSTSAPFAAPTPTVPAPVPGSASASPTVETGLPVARYPGAGTPIRGVSTYEPPSHSTYYASVFASSVTATAVASFSPPPNRPPPTPLTNFNFTNTSRRYKNVYPWKTNILTTLFWIGEGSTPISSTTNVQSSWDEDWLSNNRGSDSPYNRNGYASGSHASTLNPFYCALPFNDLAFPDKARRWLPNGWYRRPEDGKQVSACKDRWVEIKNAKGDVCYAQWEDVGPLRYDHAEYVFGNEQPTGLGGDHAGLDVSPAVADYLNLNDKNHYMSWRFVDAEDVRPGAWLKLDEQAVIFKALHQMKSAAPSLSPIQRASEPIDDPNGDESNKNISGKKG